MAKAITLDQLENTASKAKGYVDGELGGYYTKDESNALLDKKQSEMDEITNQDIDNIIYA